MVDSIRHMVPLWAVALVIAASAPWLVRAFADVMERRVRLRAVRIVTRAQARRRT
jgi:hypothetical protein